MEYLLYGLAVYGLLVACRYLIFFQRLLGLTLQYIDYEIRRAEEIPAYIKDLFEIPLPELEKLGFQFHSYFSFNDIYLDASKSWGMVLYNEAFRTFANVNIRSLPESVRLFTIEFLTFFEDGVLLHTMNGQAYGVIGEIPNTILQDPYAVETQEQWQVHQDKLEHLALTKMPLAMSSKTFIETLRSHHVTYIDSLVKSGQLSPIKGTPLLELNLSAAMKTAIKLGRDSGKYTTLVKKWTQKAKTEPYRYVEIPSAVEVEGFRRMERIERGRARKGIKSWLLLGSLVVFAISFTPFFDLQTLLILVGVLFLHELGHFLTMRGCGYKDTSIFFLPLFGAAASGRKENATIREKFLVLLAGPVPGIILGVAIALAIPDSLQRSLGLQEVISFLVIINYFNLLPILPLDGGRILDLLIFSRHPYTDVLFKLFAVGLLVFIGMSPGTGIFLFLGFLIAFSIPASFRSAKILKILRRELPQSTDDSDSVLMAIFHTLNKSGYSSLPFAQKYRMVKDIAQRCRESHSSWGTRLLLLGVYLMCLFGGLVIAFVTLLPQSS
ncbi:site-2 protease family protein [Coleofasciculus sp. FACHB-64]|uniref:site-2 protease family protein n=1 Tax=Cyanophyceae TaxID=3028117 RepID=UPI0016881CD3|nr:site-2 protease family protein [Coleofasciculus sp. FACHB-64]MBD2046167.1 site-2 protease family protein [Coleofasciculus sp. FACHB-64]